MKGEFDDNFLAFQIFATDIKTSWHSKITFAHFRFFRFNGTYILSVRFLSSVAHRTKNFRKLHFISVKLLLIITLLENVNIF